MPPVECLYCGEIIEFPQRIVDAQKYIGQVRCNKCRALLHIKKVGIEVQEYQFIEKGFIPIKTIVKHHGQDGNEANLDE